MLNLVFVKLQE